MKTYRLTYQGTIGSGAGGTRRTRMVPITAIDWPEALSVAAKHSESDDRLVSIELTGVIVDGLDFGRRT